MSIKTSNSFNSTRCEEKEDLAEQYCEVYNNLKNKYGDILSIKFNDLHPNTIITTFPVNGIKYNHVSKTKEITNVFDKSLYRKIPTEFEEYILKLFKTSRDSLDSMYMRSYTNLGFMREEFSRKTYEEGVYAPEFKYINRNDLKVFAGDTLIWIRVLDENNEIVKKFDGNIREEWSLDYMISKVEENKFYRKRYYLNIGDGLSKTVCELCGEVKDNDDLTLDYKRVRRHGMKEREENYCGCYNLDWERFTCIKEYSLSNLFRKQLVPKGYLIKTISTNCNFIISDEKYCNKREANITIQVNRVDESLDKYFTSIGFTVDTDKLNPEYRFYKSYSDFIEFARDIDKLYDDLLKLPNNKIFLFDGYKREDKNWKEICIEEVNNSK